ncbi:MAG: tetratricopeptide repeat protein, partial [Promethearchaeota archaeon]
MSLEENEVSLLEKAREEESNYNFLNAAKLYYQVAKSYSEKKEGVKAREIIHDLIIYYGYLESVKTAEEFMELIKEYVKLFEEVVRFCKKNGYDLERLEIEAFSTFYKCFTADTIEEAERMANKGLELSSNLFERYLKKNDEQAPPRIVNELRVIYLFALFNYLNFCKEPEEFKELTNRTIEISGKIWKHSMESRNMFDIVFSLYIECSFVQVLTMIEDFKGKKQSIEAFKNVIYKCEESIKFLKPYNNPLVLTILYHTYGFINSEYGYKHIDDEIEQRNYFDKGIKYLEMGLDLARKVKNKIMIVWSLYLINQYAFISGKFMYLQKRIINDIMEIMDSGNIFAKSFGLLQSTYFFTNYLPAFYYSNVAQLSFFTPNQRKSYAEKGIEYASKTLDCTAHEYLKSFSFLSLTISYAVLTRFAETKKDQDINIKQMFYYANETKRISEKYGRGQIQALAYNSLNRAYKTLADVSEEEEQRIEMLLSAADASKNYLKHASESRSGNIAAQMRLALLYEEIGILTKNNERLLEAKELLLDAVKGSLEKGYYSYAGTTYEYIARIEDRLSNHTSSAENYLKAEKNHSESLKSIEYRPLKERVKQKIQYANAWNLIEKSKAYHKNEDHLKAKDCYENASKILKKIPKYNFEGFYNAAWAMLEEAEFLSKQEKQEEAINQYKNTIKAFEETIHVLKEASEKATEQPEKERIDKLEKVAIIRINYCSARINLEEAIILGKKGEHSIAAEKFGTAASVFRGVCTRYKLERERKELEAIYYLCRAWESMELAEKFEEPERFDYAANLFTKASNLFVDTKLKLLALGNSAVCQALELSCKFDESTNINMKMDLYPKVKLMLSKAASSYGKSGYESVANWALASSIYFDAAWHLIQADKELDITEKGRLLGIGSNYLKSSIELFSKAGYGNKVAEVQDRLNRVEKEESILFSALSTIREPSISRSTVGIVAPSCPIESSLSPRLGEARQFTEEELRVTMERERKKYELIYKD